MNEAPEIRFRHGRSAYLPLENVIYLSSREDDVVHAIDHEIKHWAGFMLLSEAETDKVCREYSIAASNERLPFLEKILE